MAAVVNFSAYLFTPFAAEDLPALRERLKAHADELGLRGTVLLSTEGINLFVAGSRAAVDAFLAGLRAVPGLAGLTPKESESAEQPFNRMLVKIKKEIIAFGVEGIDPARQPAPRLDPRTLKQWLDEGRPVTLLDTRNDYEIRLGTFKNALVPGIDHFRDFPAAGRHLLHRGNPLRKGRALPGPRGLRAGLPARGRHPEVFRDLRRGALRGRMFRLRPPGGRGRRPARDRFGALFRLPDAAHRRRAARSALRAGHLLSALHARRAGSAGAERGAGVIIRWRRAAACVLVAVPV